MEDKVEENKEVFYVCKSSTSGGKLLTQTGWFISARIYGFFLRIRAEGLVKVLWVFSEAVS